MPLTKSIHKQENQDIIAATDQCVMCGLCLPHCPTYTIAKNESESPRGRISLVRALYEGKLSPSKNIGSHLDHCLSCLNCENVCPANIDYEKIIDAGRNATYKQQSLFTRLQQSLLLFSLANHNARRILKTCITFLQIFGIHHWFSNFRLLSLIPNQQEIPQHTSNKNQNTSQDRISVAIINSCAGDAVNDQTLSSAKLILSKLNCEITQQSQIQCCGALHQHSGDLKTAQKLRERFLHSFSQQKPDHLLSLTTGCGAQIKRYPKFDNTLIANETANKLVDINEFLLQQIKAQKLTFKPLRKKVYLHKPCSQFQITDDKSVIDTLLKFIPEIETVLFQDDLTCCGAGGINTFTQGKLAQQLIENKILEMKNDTANYLVSSNIGCALHFQAQIKREKISVQVCHPITLLAQQVI